jgi:hypothetical protein
MKAWLLLLAALGGIVCLTVLESFQETATPAGESVAVTYSHGTVRVSIPYAAPHAGAGQLTVEVLDPDDQALGRAEQSVAVGAGKGRWQEDLKLTKPMAIDELAWQRLRYQLFLRRPSGRDRRVRRHRGHGIHLADPAHAGGPYPGPAILFERRASRGAGDRHGFQERAHFGRQFGAHRIGARRPESPRALFTGRLNARGTAEAQFRFPAGLVGSYPLRYVAETPIGEAEFTQQVRLEDKVQILLTTEKPIYQPGQTIHVRALALDRARHAAAGGRKLTFEVRRFARQQGVQEGHADRQVRHRVGRVRSGRRGEPGDVSSACRHGEPEAGANTAELALNVERYVVPKFKVAVDLAGKDNHAKRGYRPGDHVTGTVRANYFFGKPVDSAQVGVKASGVDVAQFEAVSVQGKTDPEGTYRFDLRLPRLLRGPPAEPRSRRCADRSHSEGCGRPCRNARSSRSRSANRL